MANYKESTLQGTSWRRCRMIQINNPHASLFQQKAAATFYEEDVIDLGNGQLVFLPEPGPKTVFSVVVDPTKTFDIYDPITGQKVEGQTMSHAQLYGILYSAYRTEAEKRDLAYAEASNTTSNTINTIVP